MNNMSDLVSVIVPAYNTGKYILNILSSIVNQTYKNIELIIVNDGSSDNTESIICEYFRNIEFNWKLFSIKNAGVSNARNLGISKSHGRWIICPDSDDYISPNMIGKLLSEVLSNNADIAFAQYKTVDLEHICQGATFCNGSMVLERNDLKRLFFYKLKNFVIPATLIKKEIAQNLLFDNDCPYAEDVLYTWELIYNINKAVCIDSDLYNYLMRPGSKQHSLNIEMGQKAIFRYSLVVENLKKANHKDKYVNVILPSIIMGVHHVAIMCGLSYDNYIASYRKYQNLVTYKTIFSIHKLNRFLYMLIFRMSPKLFYKLSLSK